MDKSERETRDLMNVESFSQLPFIRRPAPVKEKSSGGAIRLFGKEFTTKNDDQSDHDQVKENNVNGRQGEHNNNNSRKFECHYCCRNFPTSQALGGHQNAHKRERQHAKRAHLQSAMVHGGLDAHDYSLMTSYNRLPTPTNNSLPIGYHPWNGSAPPTTRLYGNAYNNNIADHHQPLINGSPFAMWRIPTAPFSREHALIVPKHPSININNNDNPLFNCTSRDHDHHRLKPLLGYESKASMQDHVSLDLHL